jgi:PhnB protein
MKRLDPYLNFSGNIEDAFKFYKSVFRGEFTTLMRFRDMPGTEKMNEEDKSKIMHVALPIGDGNVLMGTDILDSQNQKLQIGYNVSLSFTLSDEEETIRIFGQLSENGEIIMPLSSESWSDLFGICIDQYGVQWMLNYVKPQV